MVPEKRHSEEMHVACVSHQRRDPEEMRSPGAGKVPMCLLLAPCQDRGGQLSAGRAVCVHRAAGLVSARLA